jgi:hypothetical protein
MPLPEDIFGKGAGFVGSHYDATIPVGGRLFLGFNDDTFSDNSGSFSVHITVQAPATAVPEPTTLALFGLGAGAFAAFGWMRRRRRE